MANINGSRLSGVVRVEGQVYENCTFDKAVLEYGGGEPPRFNRCAFNGCRWKFTGSALRTVTLLQGLNQVPGGDKAIADLFPFVFRIEGG